MIRRLRLRKLRAETREPRVSRNWEITNIDDALYRGVCGVTYDPDPGIPVSDLVRDAKRRKRQIEDAWLRGVTEYDREQANGGGA